MDALRIEIGCTVSNLNRKRSTTTAALLTRLTLMCTVPLPGQPHPQKHPQSHDDFGMITVSMSAPTTAVPTIMCCSSSSEFNYKNASFPLLSSIIMEPPLRSTTTIPPHFFSIQQTGDVDVGTTTVNGSLKSQEEEGIIRNEEHRHSGRKGTKQPPQQFNPFEQLCSNNRTTGAASNKHVVKFPMIFIISINIGLISHQPIILVYWV